jgi:hypothetical protein
VNREESVVLDRLAADEEWRSKLTLTPGSYNHAAYAGGFDLDHLVTMTGLHSRAVRRALARLEAAGAVIRTDVAGHEYRFRLSTSAR